MNNSFVLEKRADLEEAEEAKKVAKSAKEKLAAARQILEALRTLKGNREFKIFIKHVLGPQRLTLEKKVRSERDNVELLRAQGGLKLAELLDVDFQIKNWVMELEKQTQRSKEKQE